MNIARRKVNRRKSYNFTLLEICICLAILGVVSGFLGWKIVDAIGHHRFEASSREIVREVKRLQGLALSYQGEFGIRIFEEKEKFYYTLFSDEPIDTQSLRIVRPLNGITSLSLGKKTVSSISLTVLPTGAIKPHSVMGLHHKDQVRWLDTRSALHIKVQKSYSE